MDMKSDRTRREVLALVASGSVVGSAGCLNEESDDAASEVETDVECDPTEHSSLSSEVPVGAWSPTRGNQRRTGANLDMEPLGLDDVDQLQATELFSGPSVDLPAVADGTLYVDNDETVAIDVESGETDWALTTRAVETPLVTHDTVYVSAGGLRVLAIDRERGEFRWVTTLEQEPPYDDVNQAVVTVPLVAEGTVIVGHMWFYGDDRRGWFTALDARCGSERWSVSFEQDPRGIATDGQTVYAATDHHLYALDAEDGTEHWRTRVTDEYLDSDAPPALAGETVLVKDQNHLYALSTVDGSERWNTVGGLEVEHPPTVTSDTVYVVESESSHVIALDIESGETRWRYTDIPGEIYTQLTYLPGRLYAFETHSEVLVLDTETGTKHTALEYPPYDARISPDTISEIAITPAGMFTHAHPNEGGSEHVHRFY